MKRPVAFYMLLIMASIFLFFFLNLVLGSVSIPLRAVWNILWGTGNESVIWQNIIWKSRVPQALTALVAGAGLSVSGLHSALQYEGSEAQFISGLAAGEDIFFREPVASGAGIAPADAAVETVVFAVIGEFDPSADIDVVSVMALLFFPCQCEEILCEIRGASGDQADPFVFRQLPGVS